MQILSDEMATLSFEARSGEGADMGDSTRAQYSMQLKSKHMKTNVTNRCFPAKPKDQTEIRSKYKVSLKKEVFIKFFMILRLAGQGLIKMNHKQVIEMEYTLEK